MNQTKPTQPNITWSPGDADIARLQEKTGASVLTLYRVDCPAGEIVSNLYFEGSDFLWCTQGSFRFEFSDREPVTLHRGEFIVTFPGRFVSIIALEEANALRGGIIVGHRHEEFLLRMGFWDCFIAKNKFSKHNLAVLQNLIDKRTTKGGDRVDLAILRHTHFMLQSVLASLRSGRGGIFLDAVKFINCSFLDGDAVVKPVYSAVYCSAPTLIEAFKAHNMLSPSEYLNRLQSWWACRLLTRTHLTLDEIAHACGFSNGSSFTRFFRQWIGVSPSAVRKGTPYHRHPPTNVKCVTNNKR